MGLGDIDAAEKDLSHLVQGVHRLNQLALGVVEAHTYGLCLGAGLDLCIQAQRAVFLQCHFVAEVQDGGPFAAVDESRVAEDTRIVDEVLILQQRAVTPAVDQHRQTVLAFGFDILRDVKFMLGEAVLAIADIVAIDVDVEG